MVEQYGRVERDTSNRLQQDVPFCAAPDRSLSQEIRIQYFAAEIAA